MAEGFINADEALEIKPEIEILTSGISMRPMLRQHRDIVVIKRANGRLKKHDVPLYRREGCPSFVLHRILKVKEDGYIIRGDNLYYKEYVKDADIIGVLKAFYRDGKYIDCATSVPYKIYIILMRAVFPFRWVWVFVIRRVLSKVYRTLKKIIKK